VGASLLAIGHVTPSIRVLGYGDWASRASALPQLER
jgi:hypothetical protein